MHASLNIWILLFIAAAAQGLFLSVVIIQKNKHKTPSQNTLGTLVLAFTLTLSYYVLFWIGINNRLPLFFGLFTQLTYLFGPLTLLYLRQLHKKKATISVLHALPWLIISILVLFNNYVYQSSNLARGLSITQCLHLVFYTIFLIRYSITQKSDGYVKNIIMSFGGYVLCFCAYYTLVWTDWLKIEYDYMVSSGMAIFIYFLGYQGYNLNNQDVRNSKQEKYAKSNLTSAGLSSLEKHLDIKMKSEKYFLNNDLKIQDLAEKLEINLHSLSQTINVKKNKSFNDYINELRIEEAKRLMLDDAYRDVKLISIAFDTGFNNKTSFLNAFKKHTQQTPSQFRKSLLNEVI